MKMTAKATVDSVRLEMISEMVIKQPFQISEQKQIAEFFDYLNNLITLHQRECFYIYKKYLLFLEMQNSHKRNYSWEQRKFEDLYSYASEGGTPDTNNSSFYKDGTIPFVKIEDTENKYIDSTKSHISVEGLNHSSAWLIPAHNILFTNGATVGNVAINRIPVATKQGILGIIPSKQVTVELMFYLLSSTLFQREVKSRMATGTFATIILKNLNQIPVCIPTNKNEQNLITYYLSQLDNLITLHQCESCKKVGAVQSAFARRNLSKWADSWEQRKLEILITEYKRTVDSGCTYPVLSSSKTEGVVLQEEHFGRKQQHDITGYNILPRNYCTYRNRSDGVDFTFNVNNCCDIGIISKFYPVFYGNNNDTFFLSLLLNNSDEVVHEIAYTCTGTGQKVLSFLDLQKMFIKIPTYIEQRKISTLFRKIDNLITLHQCKVFYKNIIFKNIKFGGLETENDTSWEQRKVGDLLIERNQQAPMSDEYPLMAFIANEGVAPKGERYDRSSLVTDTVNKLYKKTEKGDFIYSSNNLETGSIGLNKHGKACISPVYSIFEPTGIADSDFLGRRLVRKDFINAMVKWRQGVIYGQWRIHESDFLKIEIPVPSVEEQRKIGAYLDQLDNLITLHQRIKIFITGDYHDKKNK